MTKADIETLLFSIYIEQILKKDADDFSAYSDFRLSKELGIPQSRVANLKVKKQLQYPSTYSWRDSFTKVSRNARYENGKIKIQIPDINLYYEVKNAVEEAGGYVDVTLTQKLLQISPEYFLDLLVVVSEEKNRKHLRENLRDEIRKYNKDKEYWEGEPLGRYLSGCGKDVISSVLQGVISNAAAGSLVTLVQNVLNAMQ